MTADSSVKRSKNCGDTSACLPCACMIIELFPLSHVLHLLRTRGLFEFLFKVNGNYSYGEVMAMRYLILVLSRAIRNVFHRAPITKSRFSLFSRFAENSETSFLVLETSRWNETDDKGQHTALHSQSIVTHMQEGTTTVTSLF